MNDIKYFKAEVEPRYWEDSFVNGVEANEDDHGIPFRFGNVWLLYIDIETGTILDWPPATSMFVHFKVCDCGTYSVLDSGYSTLVQKEGYVPSIMCPGGDGWGDYIIMNINEFGQIEKWDPSLIEEFLEDE